MTNWMNYSFYGLYALTVISCIVVVLKENRNPIRSLAWVIALIFLPFAGLIFYLFFGRSLRGQRMISRHNKRKMIMKMRPHPVNMKTLSLGNGELTLIKLARNISSAFYAENNKVRIFTNGADKFNALKEDLRKSRHSIYLQYYIFQDDALGREIAEILKQKAREGVDVKVIYDHFGSFGSRNSFFRDMQEAGVDTHPFFKLNFPQFANRINWRNHRKIVVIDGRIGYIGGMNIADRYDRGNDNGIPWRDTHFRIEGDIVESLAFSFAVDWNFRNQPHEMDYPLGQPAPFRNTTGIQLVTSGPLGEWDSLALCYLKAISMAQKAIYIQTPYFLPTDALQHALEAAALSKVDVRLMIPRKSDSIMLRYATYSYVTQCLRAGIKVYLYNPGMLHAKAMIIDENIVIAGSTNFDFRSFENNFECSIIIYDREINRQMRDIFFRDMGQCTRINYESWHKRPRLQRAWESTIRLLSPIL